MEPIHLPGLYCPFPSAINRHAEALHQHTIEWVRKFNLIPDERAFRRFCQSRFADLAARVYPEATYTELTLLSDWNVWLFCLDDQFDEEHIGKKPELLATYNAKLLNIFKDADTANQAEPLVSALEDIWQRIIQRQVDVILMNRFIQSVQECLAAATWEATNRARGITPDVATYIKMRGITSGWQTILELICINRLFELPPELLSHTNVQRLSTMANNIICWANDIFSFDKEMRWGDVHNLVLTVRHEHQCTLQEAIRRAARLHDNEVQAFEELETQLPSFGREMDFQLKRYVSSLRYWISGSFDWHLTSKRYNFAKEVALR